MIKYVLYSKEQYDKVCEINSKIGRKYIPGSIIISGESKRFTEISDSFNNRFKDVIIVYQGELDNVKYIPPKVVNIKR